MGKKMSSKKFSAFKFFKNRCATIKGFFKLKVQLKKHFFVNLALKSCLNQILGKKL